MTRDIARRWQQTRELVSRLRPGSYFEERRPGATRAAIDRLEERLGFSVGEHYRTLLGLCDGYVVRHDAGEFGFGGTGDEDWDVAGCMHLPPYVAGKPCVTAYDFYGEVHLFPIYQIDYDFAQTLYHPESDLVISQDGEVRRWGKLRNSLYGYLGLHLATLRRVLGLPVGIKRYRWSSIQTTQPALYEALSLAGEERRIKE